MIRELFHIGPLAISPFGVMLALAFLAAYWQVARGLERLGAGSEEDASAILLWAGIGGIAGAKIYYAILHRDASLLLDRSGLVWYGGFILGAVAVIWTIRRRRLAVWPVIDVSALGLALGYGIGRVGCFLVGDDYGVPTGLPWGVAFPEGLPPTEARWLRSEFGVDIPPGISGDELMRVHPTQLYETMAALAIWLVGRRLLGRSARPGSVALVVFPLLAIERFLIELLRAKDDRFLGPFTLAQAISLVVLVTCLALWLHRRPAAETS